MNTNPKTVKITLTYKCDAKCLSCPAHLYKNRKSMSIIDLDYTLNKILNEKQVKISQIIFNNVGDFTSLDNSKEYFETIAKYSSQLRDKKIYLVITTNGNNLYKFTSDYIDIFDLIIISFNGGVKQNYNYMTNLDFISVYRNIEFLLILAKTSKTKIEIHSLSCKLNKIDEQNLKGLFQSLRKHKDFGLRLSYKYDNQMKEDYTLDEYKDNKRIICDYLINTINIDSNLDIKACPHDWENIITFGNLKENSFNEIEISYERLNKIAEHKDNIFNGICSKCNFNVTNDGKFKQLF